MAGRINCDVCSRNMTNKKGETIIALRITVGDEAVEAEDVDRMFGKKDFNICGICFLKALKVKENGR